MTADTGTPVPQEIAGQEIQGPAGATAGDHPQPVLDLVVRPGDGYAGMIPAGARFRIIDLEGNQAVDTLFYDAADLDNRYSAVDTIREQGRAYLTTGSRLLSVNLDLLATVVDDTCGRHDTLGGACAQESNVVRYGMHTRHQHACRETFLRYGAMVGIDARRLTHNINFFMNVPLTPDGGLTFADGVSAPGRHVEILAGRDIVVLISNCPQLNNPCNGWNPTPVRLLQWEPR
jgi:urea carboxylase-associated protein 1